MYGVVTSIEKHLAGTQLIGAHPAGALLLNVFDVSSLTETGQIQVGADLLTYSGLASCEDPDSGLLNDQILLPTATTSAYPDQGIVTLIPAREYKTALVQLDNDPTLSVECLIKHSLQDKLPEGPRQADAGEIVSVVEVPGELTQLVDDIRGKRAAVDGGYLDPDLPVTPGAITKSLDQYPDQYANTIHAEAIKSGSMTADVAVVGQLVSGGGSGQGKVVINGEGLYTTDMAGNPRTTLPNDPTQPDVFRGVVDVDRANVSQGASLNGPSVLGSGATLTMLSGIAPPTLSPSVTTGWPALTVKFADRDLPGDRIGLALKSLTEAYCVTIDRLLVFNPTTGVTASRFLLPMTNLALRGVGYASVANQVRTLERTKTGHIVAAYTYSGTPATLVGQLLAVPTILGVIPAFACASQAGADVVYVGQSQPDGTIRIWAYSGPSFTQTIINTPVLTSGAAGLMDLAIVGNVALLAFVGGWVDPATGNTALPMIDLTTGALLGSIQVANGDTSPCGVAHLDGDTPAGRSWYLSGASDTLYQHSDPLEGGTYWAQGSWRDSASGHETLPGPAVQVTKLPGSQITIALGTPPAGADSASLYLGAGATQPANSAMWLQGSTSPVSSVAAVTVFAVKSTGSHPLTVPNLTGGLLSEIRSADGTAALRSDKTGWLVDRINAVPCIASVVSGTTDAAGSITFTHALGVIPKAWQAWSTDFANAAAQFVFVPQAATATTATFTCRAGGGAAQVSKAVTAQLVVYR